MPEEHKNPAGLKTHFSFFHPPSIYEKGRWKVAGDCNLHGRSIWTHRILHNHYAIKGKNNVQSYAYLPEVSPVDWQPNPIDSSSMGAAVVKWLPL